MLAQDTHAPKTVHGAQWEKKGQQHQFGRTGFHVFFFCFGTCAIIKHKGKLIPQAKQLPVKIDMASLEKPRKIGETVGKMRKLQQGNS